MILVDKTDQLSEVAVETHILLTSEFLRVPGESSSNRLERVTEHDVLDRSRVGSEIVRVSCKSVTTIRFSSNLFSMKGANK